MIRIYHKTSKEKVLKIIPEFKKDSWIFVDNPTEKELSFLSGKYNLEESLLRDAMDPNEVPRLEIEDKILYTYIRFPLLEHGEISTTPILIAIGPDFILTLGEHLDELMDFFRNGKNENYSTHRVSLFLKLLNTINNLYTSYLHDIRKKVRSASVKLEKIENKDILRFVNYENVLNDFLSALVPTNAMLTNLLNGRYLKLDEEYNDLIEDISLSINEIVEVSKSTLKNMVNIREAYSTIITNNLNRIIKLLTSLTVLLAIPTMLASIYGMNINLPFHDSQHAFTTIILISSLISAILIYIFYKKDWL